MSSIKIWREYYDHAQLSPFDVRPGCEPRFMVYETMNEGKPANAIVLVHGLTDSPYFMEAVGCYFHEVMGFNVYIPLLTGHGLNEPDGMRGVTLQQWLADVDFAIDCAHAAGDNVTVSIGGLSTGGALSVDRAFHLPDRITGAVFLFSAALDLAGKYGHFEGDLKEFLLRLDPLTAVLGSIEDKKPMLGCNPYRYARMDLHGATQLAALLADLDRHLAGARLSQPLFAAHSAADTTADIAGIENLVHCCTTSTFFCISKEENVPHASVVLQQDLRARDGSVLETQNRLFLTMMATARQFAKQHLANVA